MEAASTGAAASLAWLSKASWSGGAVSFEQPKETGAKKTETVRANKPWYKDEFIRALNYFGAVLEVKG
jgi:hypothetical protein